MARYETGPQGTFSRLRTPGGFGCEVLELPWRDNLARVSCIPTGEYQAEIRESPRFGKVYWLRAVPGRSLVLLHQGNLAGEEAAGWKTHSQGCLLLGKYRGMLAVAGKRQKAVLASLPTLHAFMAAMAHRPFILKIVEAYDV